MIKILSDIMNILEQINQKEREEDDCGDCRKCKNFSPFDEGKCFIYGIPSFGISKCPDWELSEFWQTKRGY